MVNDEDDDDDGGAGLLSVTTATLHTCLPPKLPFSAILQYPPARAAPGERAASIMLYYTPTRTHAPARVVVVSSTA